MSQAQKTPLSRTLNQFASAKAIAEIKKRGLSLPGKVVSVSGQIVTVTFLVSDATLPDVTIPIGTSAYVQLPIQEGDLGCALAMDTAIAVVSGLGSALANLGTLEGNLSALVWLPTSNKALTAISPNQVVIVGPQGALVQDHSGASVINVNPTSLSLTSNGHTLDINSTGIFLDGILFATHNHSGVQTGTGISGPVSS